MDELSMYFSAGNETSKSKLNEKSAKSFTRPTNFRNDAQQRKSFRGCIKKNKTIDNSSDNAHNPFLSLNSTPNNPICGSYSCGNISTKMPHILPPEIEEGNIEYKRKLVDPTPNRFEQLVTQMKWRLNEGGGKAIYKLGVDDDGHVSGLHPSELISSLTTLERMAKRLNSTLHPLRERVIEPTTISSDKECRKAIEVLVRLAPTTNEGSPDLCVALVGGMDSGKSTLISVLTDGELDNARGKARLNLFRHLHEVQSGRTSSLSRELLGFDANGNVTNYKYADGRVYRRSTEEVVRMSSNLLTLLDLAGHSKYQRTTLAGISCNQPIMGILVISATIGLSSIGLDHIQLIRSLNLPMIIVLTKIDQLSHGIEQIKRIHLIYRQLIYQFKQIDNAWSYGVPSSPISQTNTDYSFLNDWKLNSARGDFNDDYFMPPFFPVSSVSGQGIDNLMHFLSRLSCLNQSSIPTLSMSPSSTTTIHPFESSDHRNPDHHPHPHQQQQQSLEFNKFSNETHIQFIFNKINEQMKIIKTYRDFNGTLFWINQVFTQIPGVSNPVIVGRVQLGQLLNNQILWLGPDQFGDFYPVQIVSLMHNRQVHDIVYAGQSASMEVYFLPKSWNSMNDKQRQSILHSISSPTSLSLTSSYRTMNDHKKSFSLFGNNNDNICNDDDDNCTGNEENIPHNNNKKKNVNSLSSSPSDIYQFYSPIKIRRGMILLTYPMLLTAYSLFKTSSPGLLPCTIDSSPLSSSPSEFIWNEQLKSKHCINFTVVWTVKLKLIRRLPIVSFKLGNPPVILTPIPSIGQRVSIYAGCVCQTGVVLETINQCKHEQEMQQNNLKDYMVNNENHLDDTTYILLRFTRHPELIEIGRQFILTWNGNLKTVGYAVELIDALKHHYNLSLNTLSDNNNNATTTSTSTTNIRDPNDIHDYSMIDKIIDPICWNNNIQQNSLSFQENDHYDWSSLRQSFMNRTISMNNYPFGSIDNLHTSSNVLLLSSSLPSSNMEFYGHLRNNESCKRSATTTTTTTTTSNSLIPVNHLTSLSELVQNHDIDIDDNINNNNNNSTDIDHSTQSIIDINNVKQFSESSISSSGGGVTTFTPSSSSSSKNNKRRHRRKQKR
ncbi:unnamed protein product [Schistosoma bovis]|nr:unnamed protein product [Schistosoma bovis]